MLLPPNGLNWASGLALASRNCCSVVLGSTGRMLSSCGIAPLLVTSQTCRPAGTTTSSSAKTISCSATVTSATFAQTSAMALPAKRGHLVRTSSDCPRHGVWYGRLPRGRHVSCCHEVLERIEPAAPLMLRIAQEYPGTQNPQRVQADDDQGQTPPRLGIGWPHNQPQSQEALDRADHGGDHAQADDAQQVPPGRAGGGPMAMEPGKEPGEVTGN